MEYFIVANSFAAPFFSDRSEGFQEAESAEEALTLFAARYSHPAHLFAAVAYESATDFHKRRPAVARWLCNHEIAKQEATKDLGAYSYRGIEPGRFTINDELIIVPDPFGGRCIPVAAQQPSGGGQ